jgi:hypothetical protein
MGGHLPGIVCIRRRSKRPGEQQHRRKYKSLEKMFHTLYGFNCFLHEIMFFPCRGIQPCQAVKLLTEAVADRGEN